MAATKGKLKIPAKAFMMQKPMLRVCYALAPLTLAAVYFFGWRALAVTAVVFLFGVVTEAVFTFPEGKPVTSAVFVTCLVFSLSLPPDIPLWMAAVGIVFGVAIGKMVFGGFGRNIFNPAMVGRCFIYITFPLQMTGGWTPPLQGGAAGFLHWSNPIDAVTRSTPLVSLRTGLGFDLLELFLGNVPGSMGETSALLIILGGIFLLYLKAASWRLAAGCLAGGVLAGTLLHLAGIESVPSILPALLAGSFLFGMFFVVTEPVTSPNSKTGQLIYGFGIGGLTIILRGFSNFSEGVMFSVLIFNACAPLIDQVIKEIETRKKTRAARAEN
ncbi:MAG: RnfABCDGE type electron transport complex subunit D [Pseudomonadota bacterium]